MSDSAAGFVMVLVAAGFVLLAIEAWWPQITGRPRRNVRLGRELEDRRLREALDREARRQTDTWK